MDQISYNNHMITYQEKQEKLFNEIENKFKQGKAPTSIVEPVKDYARDRQICLTSVVFLSEELQQSIGHQIIEKLKVTDNKQYYYPASSLHLTIQNIRVVHDPPRFNDQDIQKAKQVFAKVIRKYKRFSFQLKGLFDLPTSLGIRGYCDQILRDLVLELRSNLKQVGVPDDKSYGSDEIMIGNVTVCRYPTRPNKEFFTTVDQLKDVNIGTLAVQTVALVTTNSVCHPDKTKIIGTYNLR